MVPGVTEAPISRRSDGQGRTDSAAAGGRWPLGVGAGVVGHTPSCISGHARPFPTDLPSFPQNLLVVVLSHHALRGTVPRVPSDSAYETGHLP